MDAIKLLQVVKLVGVVVFGILVLQDVSAQYNNIYVESAWEERDRWQRADEIVRLLGVEKGAHVADIGCHQGYMTVKLAKVVNSGGRVYAVDVDEYKLRRLEEILRKQKLSDPVEIIEGDYDDPKLPVNTLDAVLILDTYHEISDYKEVLGHIKNALKPGGRLVIIDPIANERKSWSRERQNGKHELAMRYAIEDVSDLGFEITKSEDPWIDRTEEKGDKMWMLVAVRP